DLDDHHQAVDHEGRHDRARADDRAAGDGPVRADDDGGAVHDRAASPARDDGPAAAAGDHDPAADDGRRAAAAVGGAVRSPSAVAARVSVLATPLLLSAL